MRTLQRELGRLFQAPPKRGADLEAPARRAFKRLAEAEGFTFAKARDGYLEIAACAAFPDGLVTAFHGWADALERVRHCLANPAAIIGGGYTE